MSPAVIVTGASGFIGSGLVPRLGSQFTGALSVRGDDWPKRLRELPVDGATLVHLGGRAHAAAGDAAGIHEDNCVKSIALAELARAQGLKRFVFVSSVKVHGDSTDGRAAFTEGDALAPMDAYARTKRDAEAGLARIAGATGLEVVVLRPPLVYGPGVRGNFLALLELARARWPLPFASLGNRRSMVSRANLVAAIESCIAHPQAAGQAFLVADGPAVSTPRLVTAMREAMGRPPRLFPFPGAALRAIAALAGRGGEARRLTESLEVDDSRLRTMLGWRPAQGFEAAIGETVLWFLATGAARR